MKRRQFVALVAGVAVIWPWGVHAQQPTTKIPRIGFLANIRSPLTDDFERGLSEIGYVQGKNIFIEWRLAQGNFERLPELAADLVRLNVDLIVAPAPAYIRAARQATSSIPIVFALPGDPVGDGFVASLARPGGNITGLTSIADDLVKKMLELLKETIPSLTRIALLCDRETIRWRGELETAARLLKIQLNILEVRDPAQLDAAFSTMVRERSDAVMVLAGVYLYPHRSRIPELTMKHKLPSILDSREYADAGGLMVYAANLSNLMSRSATYVDKILKGAKPADLPVEQPTKFELVINLKTAKALNPSIPHDITLGAYDA